MTHPGGGVGCNALLEPLRDEPYRYPNKEGQMYFIRARKNPAS